MEAVGRDPARYQLVLMDCHMPVMDGYAAARAIRELERGRGGHVPIVAMTASALQSDREACIAAGMDDFLSKPVRRDDLRAMIARWIASPDVPEPPTGPERSPSGLLDPAALAELRAIDADEPGFLAELVQTYLHESAIQLAALHAARGAGDAAALTYAAHRLRGSSANLGATLLVELCSRLEAASRAGDVAEGGALVGQVEAAFAQVRGVLFSMGS